MLEKLLKVTLNKQAQQVDHSQEMWDKITQELDNENTQWQQKRRRIRLRTAIVSSLCVLVMGFALSQIPQVKAFTQGVWKKVFITYDVVFDGEEFVLTQLEEPMEVKQTTYYSDKYETIEAAISGTGIPIRMPAELPDHHTANIYGLNAGPDMHHINVFYEAENDIRWTISADVRNQISSLPHGAEKVMIGESLVHISKAYSLKYDDNDKEREHVTGIETIDFITWKDEAEGLIYSISGNLAVEEMLKMAESMIVVGASEGISEPAESEESLAEEPVEGEAEQEEPTDDSADRPQESPEDNGDTEEKIDTETATNSP